MTAVSAALTPSRARRPRRREALSATPWCTSTTPSSLIRRVTAAEARPETTAISTPARLAAWMASPSLTWKRLVSSPDAP